jgi:phytoene desaturase
MQKKAIIIGSGVAGLATATRLAIKGYAVTVFEKNSVPGGKLTAFNKDGFHFDAGPSLFTQPQNIEALFADAGEDINEYFTYEPVDLACKYFFEDGTQINAYTDAHKFADELQQKVQEPAINVTKYLGNAEKLYNKIGKVFLNYSLHKVETWLHPRILVALTEAKFSYLFKSLASYNKKFATNHTQQIFNRFATYNGSNPYKAPAMLSLIPHLEQNEGTFYPKGGMVAITNALYNLALKKNVQFVFDAEVQNIIAPSNKASGVVVNKKNYYADIVVSNMEVYFTYNKLLQNATKANKIVKQERSSSAFVFYWGVNKVFEQLHLHNILFSTDYKKEFTTLFDTKKLFDDPTVYINITSKLDAAHAPQNNENWFVMVNTPSVTNYNVEAVAAAVRKNIIKKINSVLKVDIEQHIVTEEMLYPQLIEQRTNSYLGALYGSSSNSKFAAFFRHPNFSRQIENLYFCGGSVHPGGGIPLCLKSAEITANLIGKERKPVAHA